MVTICNPKKPFNNHCVMRACVAPCGKEDEKKDLMRSISTVKIIF